MKLPRKPVWAFILGLCAVLFTAATTFATEMDQAAKELAKLDDAWSAAAATKDVDRVVAFYAEDAIAYPPNEPVAVGRAAARKVWAAYFAEPTYRLSWKTTSAGVSKSGELGFTAGTYEDSYTGPDGKVVRSTGKYLCNWRKNKAGKWEAVHDMWNTDSK